MALYSFSVKTVGRLKGESIPKIAAYQAREKIFDEHKKIEYDFTKKKGLLYSKIILPKSAPARFRNRQTLWNEAEKAEKRTDSRTGRAIIAALPNELTLKEYIPIVEVFVYRAFVSLGMCADIAIHDGCRENTSKKMIDHGNIPPNNPHVHILLTDRPVGKNGFCTEKNRDWNKKEYLLQWRKLWADIQNKAFERKGLKVRVSHLSLKAQGIKRKATIHLGKKVIEMIRHGKTPERYRLFLAIIEHNRKKELKRKLDKKHKRQRNKQRQRSLSRSR
jgi:hypothetical protein